MTDQTEKGTEPSAFEPADQIESFLAGLIAFVQGFLRTVRDLAFNQTRFGQALQNQNADAKYSKPVTFITLISFLAIRIFRFGVLTLLLAFGASSCGAETLTEKAYPSLLDELKIPSISDIILYGIPTLIVILLVSQVLKFMLLKKAGESGKVLMAITYYSVGFQYMAYLVLFSIISLVMYLQIESSDYLNYLIGGVVLVFLLWVILVFYRLVSKTIDESHLRVAWRGGKQIWLFLWSSVLMTVTTLSGWEMAYSLAKLEVADRQAKPVLATSLIELDITSGGSFSFDLLVQNNSKDEVSLETAEVFVYGKLMHPGQIIDSCQGQAPVIILQSIEACWLTISFDVPGTPYSSSYFSWDGLISFNAISPSGGTRTISAYIRSGEVVFKVSEID